jgi:hypothetical protein
MEPNLRPLPPDITRKTRGAINTSSEYFTLKEMLESGVISSLEYGNRLVLLLETNFPPIDSAQLHLRQCFASGQVISEEYINRIALLRATQKPEQNKATTMLRHRLASMEIGTVEYLSLLHLTSLPYAPDSYLSHEEQILLGHLAQGTVSLQEYISTLPRLRMNYT